MRLEEVRDAYFQWLHDWMCGNRWHPEVGFDRLLAHLHDTDFVFSIRNDQNRAEDGVSLRYRFARSGVIDEPADYILECLAGPCSVLEMMIALAKRCEEDYMDDPAYGDRTTQWFWEMITNLGLGNMIDKWYDQENIDDILQRFLYRKYDRDGRGGLFRVRGYKGDMRKLEIWRQMCYYLDTYL